MHCSSLLPCSYRSVRVAEDSVVAEVVAVLVGGGREAHLVEVWPGGERTLHPEECPLEVVRGWGVPGGSKGGEEKDMWLEVRPGGGRCGGTQREGCGWTC